MSWKAAARIAGISLGGSLLLATEATGLIRLRREEITVDPRPKTVKT